MERGLLDESLIDDLDRSVLGRPRTPDLARRTDADGLAEFPHVPRLVLAVSAPGLGRTVAEPYLRAETEHVVHLPPGHQFAGRVVEFDGTPVAGALVIVASGQWGGRVGFERLYPSATTDADGRFRVLDAPAARSSIYVEAPGRALVAWGVARVPAATGLVVRMPEFGALEGTVVDRDGAPVPRACVWFTPPSFSMSELGVIADEHGRWRVDGLPTGHMWAPSVEARGFVPRFAGDDWKDGLRVRPGRALRADFVLDRGASLFGRVACDGAPVAGAEVEAWIKLATHDEHQVLRTKTDAAGAWRLEGAGAGRGGVIVRAPGFVQIDRPDVFGPADSTAGLLVPGSGEVRCHVEMQPGERPERTPPARPTIRLRGRVVGPDGGPPGRVRLRRWTRLGRGHWLSTLSRAHTLPVNEDGSFDFETTHYPRIGLWAESLDEPRSRSRVHGTPVEPAPMDVVFRLRRTATLRGRVVCDRRPVADARVFVAARGDRRPATDLVCDGLDVHASSDADGRFVVVVPHAGKFPVHVQAPGLGAALIPAACAPGDELEIELKPTGEIEGRVEWGDGTPCAEVIVEAKVGGRSTVDEESDNDGACWAVTDEGGRFLLREIPDGDAVDLSVERRRLSRLDFQSLWYGPVAVGARNVPLVLVPGRSFHGRVVDEGGVPLAEVRVLVRDAETGRLLRGETTEADGIFHVNGLSDPPWMVEAIRFEAHDGGEPGTWTPRVERTYPGPFTDADPVELTFPRP